MEQPQQQTNNADAVHAIGRTPAPHGRASASSSCNGTGDDAKRKRYTIGDGSGGGGSSRQTDGSDPRCPPCKRRKAIALPPRVVYDPGMRNDWLIAEIPEHWLDALRGAWDTLAFFRLNDKLAEEYAAASVVPRRGDIFAALRCCRPPGIPRDGRAAALPEDPYPGSFVGSGGDLLPLANGLAFSVPRGAPVPASLNNIFDELARDPEVPFERALSRRSGDLTAWARQGVLLLNSSLTARLGRPGSHAGLGWEPFTDAIVSAVGGPDSGGDGDGNGDGGLAPVAFMLWGRHARSKRALIDRHRHLVLETTHPSPNSAAHGFTGCGHFGAVNRFLRQVGRDSVDWAAVGDA